MIRYTNQQELEAGLAKWQRILHLQDWEIVARLVPQETFGNDIQQVGDCAIRMYRHGAEIRLASIETLSTLHTSPELRDMERSLVHELLHCVFVAGQLFDNPGELPKHQNRAYEAAIEKATRALIALDRGSSHG